MQTIYILQQGPQGSNHAWANSIFTWSLELVASGGRLIAETLVEDGGMSRNLVISSLLPPLPPFSHRLFQKEIRNCQVCAKGRVAQNLPLRCFSRMMEAASSLDF